MPLAVPRYTVRDLDSFPDDGNRYELLEGVLLVTTAPAPPHQAVTARLVRTLSSYLELRHAEIYTPGSVEIEPNVHLEPDILVVPASEPITKRWNDIRKWWLAVEVSGRASLIYDRDFKYGAYTAVGVRDVWRVDLKDQCVVVKSGSHTEQSHRFRFEWHPPELDEPLVVDVKRLFDGLE